MAEIFISHKSEDAAAGKEIYELLSASGFPDLFLDCHDERGIHAGDEWEKTLYTQLGSCRAMLLLCSEKSMRSRWCLAEFVVAQVLDRVVIPILLEETAPTGVFGRLQMIRWWEVTDRAAALERELRKKGIDPIGDGVWDPAVNPYPGLRTFREEDAAVFFGRDGEVEECLRKLGRLRQPEASRALLVLGPSGSGKSSVVRAGVVPRLRGSEEWAVVGPLVPGSDPMWELRRQLKRAYKARGVPRPETPAPGTEPRTAEAEARALVQQALALIEELPGEYANLLVVIDQFEELLASGPAQEVDGDPAPSAADRFLEVLVRALDLARGRILLLVTMRSDFLGLLQQHPRLRSMPRETLQVDAMTRDNLRSVIEKPARLARLTLEPSGRESVGLVDRLLADTETPDALPLLAFTLHKLYEEGVDVTDRELTVAEYEAAGSIQESLAIAADGILDEAALSDQAIQELRGAFLGMVRVESPGQWVREPAPMSPDRSSPEVREVLRRMVERRLLTAGEGGIRIAHEALVRNWKRLTGWLEESESFLRWRKGLREALARWEDADRDPRALLPELMLDQALEWLEDPTAALSEADRELIRASADKRLGEAEERQRRERQDLRNLAALLTEKGESAERSGDSAGAAVYFAAALERHPDHPEAHDRERQPEVDRIRAGLYRSRRASRLRFERFLEGVAEPGPALKVQSMMSSLEDSQGAGSWLGFAPDGSFLEQRKASPDFFAPTVIVKWSLDSGSFTQLEGELAGVSRSAVSLGRSRLATFSKDLIMEQIPSRLTVHDLSDGRLLAAVETDQEPRALVFADALEVLLEYVEGGGARLRDPDTLQVLDSEVESELALDQVSDPPSFSNNGFCALRVLHHHGVYALEPRKLRNCAWLAGEPGVESGVFTLSPRATYLARAMPERRVRIHRVSMTESEPVELRTNSEPCSLRFSPDERHLVAELEGDELSVWRVEDGRLMATLSGRLPRAGEALSPDGRWLLYLQGREGRLASLGDGATRSVLPGDGRVLSFDPAGSRVVCSRPGFMDVYAMAGDQEPVTLSEARRIRSAAFSPAVPDRIVSAGGSSEDSPARLWSMTAEVPEQPFGALAQPLASVSFSPEGGTVVFRDAEERRVDLFRSDGSPIWSLSSTELSPLEGSDSEAVDEEVSEEERAFLAGLEDELGESGEDAGDSAAAASSEGALAAEPGDDDLFVAVEEALGEEPSRSAGGEHADWDKPPELLSAAVSEAAGLVAVGGERGVDVVRLADRAEHPLPALHGFYGGPVAFAPDGALLAAGGSAQGDWFVRVWSLQDQQVVHEFLHVTDQIEAVAFSPNPDQPLAVATGREVQQWDLGTGDRIRSLEHGQLVKALAVSLDGQLLATAEGALFDDPDPGDYQLRLFEAATGVLMWERSLSLPITSVSLSADGRRLAVVSGGALLLRDSEGERLDENAGRLVERCVAAAGRRLDGVDLVSISSPESLPD